MLCRINLLFARFRQSRRHCCGRGMGDVLKCSGSVVLKTITGVCQGSLRLAYHLSPTLRTLEYFVDPPRNTVSNWRRKRFSILSRRRCRPWKRRTRTSRLRAPFVKHQEIYGVTPPCLQAKGILYADVDLSTTDVDKQVFGNYSNPDLLTLQVDPEHVTTHILPEGVSQWWPDYEPAFQGRKSTKSVVN